MNLQNLTILGLGIWRISSLFVQEDGPFDVFIRFRERLGFHEDLSLDAVIPPDTFWGGLFSCVWCLSLWISAIIGVAWIFYPAIVLNVMVVFALSTMAIIVNRVTA